MPLSWVPISLLAAGLAAEKTELEICSLNHQDSVGDCWACQHSLSSPGLDFSLHNSDILGKKLSVAKQTWIWSIPVAGLCSSVSPSSTWVTEPHSNNPKTAGVSETISKSQSLIFHWCVCGLKQVIELLSSVIKWGGQVAFLSMELWHGLN